MSTIDTTARTVIIAEGTPIARDVFRAAIEGAGHRVLVARSAAELLARVRANVPRIDLVVLDLRLPPGTGVDLVRGIRRLDEGRLPILILSGSIASADEVRELASLAVAGYLNERSEAVHVLPSIAPHLLPDSAPCRHSPRVAVGLPIAYRVGSSVAAALTLNLGKGGVAIRTARPLDRSSRAHLQFRLQDAQSQVDADARVVWSDRKLGMGLQFERVDPDGQAAIDEYVDAHFFGDANDA